MCDAVSMAYICCESCPCCVLFCGATCLCCSNNRITFFLARAKTAASPSPRSCLRNTREVRDGMIQERSRHARTRYRRTESREQGADIREQSTTSNMHFCIQVTWRVSTQRSWKMMGTSITHALVPFCPSALGSLTQAIRPVHTLLSSPP